MTRCLRCSVDIEGEWAHCPLCGAETVTEGAPGVSPLPTVPLVFSRRRLMRALFISSIAMIALSFAVQFLLSSSSAGPGVLRIIWLGIVSLWLVALLAVRKRRNLTKGTLYLVVLGCGLCAYWDALTGWHGWSLSYAIPIICGSSILALMITMRLTRIEVGDHILYTGVTVLVGFVPLVFVVLGWVEQPVTSIICGGLSVVSLALLLAERSGDVRHELGKRLNL